jgi:hypothetical protein
MAGAASNRLEAVTTVVAQAEKWSASSSVGTVAPVQGVTVSADPPGTAERICA